MVGIRDPNVVQTKKMCIKAVEQDGFALQYVHNQTETICMKAVKQNWGALKYVKNQTVNICMEAVKQNSYALEYVNNQTVNICMEAVKQNGCALLYVRHQTEAICIEAVREYGLALEFVRNQTEAICIEALNNYSEYKRYYTFEEVYNAIKYPLPQLINQLVDVYPSHTCVIMNCYAQNIMKTYKTGSDTICAHLVQHVNDLLYRPNNANALASHKKWHTTSSIAKTIFLMA